MWLDHLNLRAKIFIIVAGGCLGMLLVAGSALWGIDVEMMSSRQAKLHDLSDAAFGVVTRHQELAASGKVTEAEAKSAAMADLRAMRYGGSEYFWINDMSPTMLMHPVKPELEGRNIGAMTTPDGRPLFMEMIALVKREAAGFYYYSWPKPGSSEPVRKISYIRGFAPWGWIIGTGVYLDDIDTAFGRKALIFIGLVAVTTGIILLMSSLVARNLTRSLHCLSCDMGRLSGGDAAMEVAGTERRDEMGVMARALLVLRNNERNRMDLAREQSLTRAEKDLRSAELETVAGEFDHAAKDLLASLSHSAQELREAAQVMTGIAQDTSHQSEAVAEAASNADGNIQSAAGSAEMLAAAQQEISHQANKSLEIVQKAAKDADRTKDIVGSLSNATDKIGEVVNLINLVASQTNLLALNATIEAARAGEAGKGFAVVAGEVKVLAGQTSRAIKEITDQIEAVKGATSDAVHAMTDIGQTITSINETMSAIASAVDFLTDTTTDIARNVRAASVAATGVSTSIDEVKEGARHTGQTANQVLAVAATVMEKSGNLSERVTRFLGAIHR